MRPAILYRNLADDAPVVASSHRTAAPPAMLRDHHVTRRWKGRNGQGEFILAGPVAGFDTIALFGIQGVFGGEQRNLDGDTETRIRVSSADPSGIEGDVYDSGLATGRIDPAYASLITLLPQIVSGYVRIDLLHIGASALLAGRNVIGPRQQFRYGFAYGWSRGYDDLSRVTTSAGGQDFIDRDDRVRVLNLIFEAVIPADLHGVVDEIDRINGISRDVLFIVDQDSSNIARDTIWGRIQDMAPPSQPFVSLFSKSYAVRERR